jgi:hypothetical protein
MHCKQGLLQDVFHSIASQRHPLREKCPQHHGSFAKKPFVGSLISALCLYEEIGKLLVTGGVENILPLLFSWKQARRGRSLMRSNREIGYMNECW